MITAVIGIPASGKSAFAENLAVKDTSPGYRYYIATLIPFGRGGEERVKKHRKQRRNMDFMTLEIPKDLQEADEWIKARRMADRMLTVAMGDRSEPVDSPAAGKGPASGDRDIVLLDSVSCLVSNVLFDADEEGESRPDMSVIISPQEADEKAALIAGQIEELSGKAASLYVVMDELSEAAEYDDNEACFLDTNSLVNKKILEMSDRIYRYADGKWEETAD